MQNIILGVLIIASSVCPALAEDEGGGIWPVPDYSGDIWKRSALTGDWGEHRKNLADKGITLSVNNVTTFQSIVDGGKEKDEAIGGSFDYEVHMDFQKMGLWPGAFVRLFGETQFGDFINSNTGAFLAANTDGLFPLPGKDKTTLSGFIFYQFLSEWFGLFLGKIDTLDGDSNEFAHGRGNDQFLNQNLVFSTATLRTTPYSALGGGFVVMLPGENNILTFTALDPSGQPDEAGFDDAFADGVTFAVETRLEVNPLGLKGHQLFGGTYSTKDYTILDQDPRLLILKLIAPGAVSLEKSDDSWSFYYNFDQYFYTEEGDSEQGIGLFGRFGVADDKTHPIERIYNIGIGGKGIVPGRDKDTFGVGYFYLELSDKLPSAFDLLNDGQGVEVFYNIEALPWLHVTPDFQYIDSGIQTNDSAYVFGIRTKVAF
ncbi:MAG: carbohydrate porin [Desulfobacterales bacterium]|nr:MAG: carbohydrate porin [Desulfobacterales bacterium]